MMQCNFEHCPGAFHPTCAREAGLYMSVRVGAAGQFQYRAYCDTHSVLQRAKVFIGLSSTPKPFL
jgi:hypothetical protein